MDVLRGTRALAAPLPGPVVVAIGNFDGVHVGHQALLGRARAAARAAGGTAVVLTFDPHPAKVLAPALAPPLLCTRERKLELIAARGIDVTVLEPFTPELAARSPDEFVREVLVGGLHAREVVVGYDFTYGRKRGGTVDALRVAGAEHGFAVTVVPAVTVDGLVASSTKIREFVLEGNVAGARVLLGRDFDLDGTVVRGAGRGRTIGVPTANVAVEGDILPRQGVYAVELTVLDGDRTPRPAAANLGTNPTFVQGGPASLEVHVLDWAGELTDRRVRVGFRARLRGEERFPSAEALVAQIRKDIEAARRALAGGEG